MSALGFAPQEWQAICHACRWIHVRYFHHDLLRSFLLRCLGPVAPELAAKVEQLDNAQLGAVHDGLKAYQEAAADGPEPPGPSGGKTVLIVEDAPDVRDTLAVLLEIMGFRTAAAANGQEALDYLRGQPRPSVILLDLLMPVMDGWHFRERLKQEPELAAIPVVVCSAVAEQQRQRLLGEVAGIEQKPVDPERILETLRRVC